MLAKYCLDQSTEPDEILAELERETYLKTLAPQMLSGYLQGKLLEFLSAALQADRILEVGTFTGYASICLARGLGKNGILDTIEVNPELSYISEKYFKKAGLEKKIIQHIGDANELLPTFTKSYDLIFLDGAKQDYANLYPLVKNCLCPGGLLLIDNVLWSGKVIYGSTDKMTQLMIAFNKMVQQDGEVQMIILPMRDGLMMARKV